ncbi:MAG: ABC transporter permease [Planctomycetota bacterium]|jgi:peptide/nickel transport system permease protein
MRTYVIKRVLLMLPTLFGISLVLWLIVTAAPGDPGGEVFGEAREAGAQDAGESRRIFRAQYNLDKPLFWNHYVSLTPEKVLEAIRTTQDMEQPGSVRSEADFQLQDWGNYSVPPLMEAIDVAKDAREKAAVLRCLQRNAKRLGALRPGQRPTEEQKQEAREIQAETRYIEDQLALQGGAGAEEIEAKAQRWKQWYADERERFEFTGWERFTRQAFDTQFAKYWSNLLKFDLGDSHVHKEPVFGLIVKRLPISITLAVTSLVLAYLISVPLGVWSAVRHRSRKEQAVATVLFMLYSLPSFFVASLLLRYLGIGQPWDVIPVSGFESPDTADMTTWDHIKDVAWHTVAPIFCMTYAGLAALSRYAKTGVLNVIRSDYVRTARAKGLAEHVVILKHAVRNGIIPIITLLGTTLPVIVGGSVIIESVFNIPGIGYLIWDSILQRDYNVVIGETLIVGVLVMVGILVSDVLYAVVDPRISFR